MKQKGIAAILLLLSALVIIGGIAYFYSVRNITGDVVMPSATPAPTSGTGNDVMYCGGIANLPCPIDGYTCTPEGANPDAATVCVRNDQQLASGGCVIGGCSNELCGETESNQVSACIWKEEYVCYKSARCERQTNGTCGWTQTSDLIQCLQKAQNATSNEVF